LARDPALLTTGIKPPHRGIDSNARSVRLSDVNRFEVLVLPHLDAAHNLARWLTRNPDDAEDVVQEACVRALKYIGALHGDDARAWFLTIVRHAFYDWCGRNRPAEIARDDGTAIEMTIDDAAIDPEQAALRGAESRLLADAVAELPLPYREVIVLRELEELSYKEIARVADIPVGTVMSRLARARGLLQRSPLMHSIGERTSGGER
jgi:RNA polymerase sigma-70 factor (ECF subfamily)